jgi:isopenicillin N synthase-like dioxygenase
VKTSLLEKVKLEIQEFFKLPMEEKKKYRQEPGDMEGFGQAFVVSEEQKLNWADLFYMITLPTSLRKPHLFPKLPLPLRSPLSSLSLSLSLCLSLSLKNMREFI